MLELVVKANGFLWGILLIILLCGTGIMFTFRLKFIQLRQFSAGCKLLFKDFSFNGAKSENGEMTPFQAIATAIGGQVGTGNLAGAATALISGGPGAIFWMWVSAFFGMSTIYAEAVLAQEYKTTNSDGHITGGPVYYIRQAFKGTFGKVLAGAFAVFIILALGFMGNMVQANSIGSAFTEAFSSRGFELNPLVIGVLLAAIKMIFVCAFKPEAVLGGAAGITIREAIRYGVARGLFSNEAGMGSTPHAHARATSKNPHEQGLRAMISVFIDTFIILNLTAFSILSTGVISTGKTGTALAQAAFVNCFGSGGDIFVAVCLLFFAFSTILSWHFFGSINVKYLFGEKAVKIYSCCVVIFIIIGSTLKVDLVWELADFFNALMVIPNIIALVALSSVVIKISKNGSAK